MKSMSAVLAMLVVVLAAGFSPRASAATESEWQVYIEAVAQGANASANVAVGELFLPPGVGDVVNGLVAAPDVVKTGLKFWLQAKMQRAILDDDMAALDRYQAFYSCLAAERDCARVAQLTQGDRPSDANPSASIAGTWWLKNGGTFEITQAEGQEVFWTLSIPSANVRHSGHGTYDGGTLQGEFQDSENPGELHDGEYVDWRLSSDGQSICGQVHWWKSGDASHTIGAGGGSDCYYRQQP
jgi:hypothetical protein